MPDLRFAVADAEPLPFAAAPTIMFKLGITNDSEDEEIHSIMLRTQVRIDVTRRHYDSAAEARLVELFGEPQRWGETLRSLLWGNLTTIVPRFTGTTVAELPMPGTYDFEVAAAKYFYALDDGEIPLLFLFSGTVLYSRNGGGVQIAQISWENEAAFRLPVRVWKETINAYFPNSAWLRIDRDMFDRLYAYRTSHGLPTWEATLDALLKPVEATGGAEGASSHGG